MKVTGWTYWNNKKYFDPDLEHKILWGKRGLKISKEFPFVNLLKILKNYGRFIPDELNEKDAQDLIDFRNEMKNTIINYCIENKIYISEKAHQAKNYVPIIDNKFVFQASLEDWEKMMEEVKKNVNDFLKIIDSD